METREEAAGRAHLSPQARQEPSDPRSPLASDPSDHEGALVTEQGREACHPTRVPVGGVAGEDLLDQLPVVSWHEGSGRARERSSR